MRLKSSFVVLVSVVMLGAAWSSATAATRNLAALKIGMSRAQVIELLGAPQEKLEYEIKREEGWKYKDVDITFNEESVVRWYLASPRADAPLPAAELPGAPSADLPNSPAAQEQPLPRKKRSEKIEQEVLDEILRSLPSEDGPKS